MAPSIFGSDDDLGDALEDKSKVAATPRAPAPIPTPNRPRPAAPTTPSGGGLPNPASSLPRKPAQPTAEPARTSLPQHAPNPPAVPTQRTVLPQKPAQPAPAARPTLAKPTPRPEPVHEPEPEEEYDYSQYQEAQETNQRSEQESYYQEPPRERNSYPPRQRQNYGEYYEEEEPESQRPPQGRGRGKTKPKNKTVHSKQVKKTDGRKPVVIMRFVVIGGLVLLAATGVKSIVFPSPPPSSEAVASEVKTQLALTNFPATQAEGFVLGFVKTYLTVSSETASTRNEELANYADPTVLSSGGIAYPGNYTQSIVEGPYIYGIRYDTDNTAVYTVGAKTDKGEWLYLAVTVYYNPDTRAFVIAKPPTLTAPPAISKMPVQQTEPVKDDEATKAATDAVTSFFKAWGASDAQALSVVLTPDADPRALNGLAGTATLESVSSLSLYAPSEETNGMYLAKAVVRWTSGPEDSQITYTSEYQLMLTPKNSKWYIKDIRPLGFVAAAKQNPTEATQQTQGTETS